MFSRGSRVLVGEFKTKLGQIGGRRKWCGVKRKRYIVVRRE